MADMRFMIQELMQQRSLFLGKVHHVSELMHDYYQKAWTAIMAAGVDVDFSRMRRQLFILEEMVCMLQEDFHEDIFFANMDKTIGWSMKELQSYSEELNMHSEGLQEYLNELQFFDQSLHFDEVYDDLMKYVYRLREDYKDYYRILVRVKDELNKLLVLLEDIGEFKNE